MSPVLLPESCTTSSRTSGKQGLAMGIQSFSETPDFRWKTVVHRKVLLFTDEMEVTPPIWAYSIGLRGNL